jgi:threonine aldolase
MIKGAKKIIDLRSDTVTRMSASMMKALVSAEVGDDLYKDDPNINRLEEKVAQMFGMRKGLLAISGTMSNLLAILAHCQKGDSAILGELSHINVYEQGNIASIANVHTIKIPEQADSTLSLSEIESRILPENIHFAKTTLISLENTHNYLGGKVLPLSYPKLLGDYCKTKGIKLHLDGSRLLNAYYHHKEHNPNLKVSDITQGYDSVCMCLSKGLRSPLGSILAGSEEFIDKAKRWRKAIGGAIRQGGYICAAASQSIDESGEFIPADHRKTKLIYNELIKLGCEAVSPETNILIFKLNTKIPLTEVADQIKEKGILISPRPDGKIRIVLHADVEESSIDYIIQTLSKYI